MFILSTLSDLITIPPHQFHLPSLTALQLLLAQKYANRIIPKLGLVISIHSILSTSDGLIGFGQSGSANVHVTFTAIVFRPVKGEVICARVKQCTEEGVWLTLGFFEDLLVPAGMMFEGCSFEVEDQGDPAGTEGGVWVWKPGGGEEQGLEGDEANEFFFDVGTVVHARVESEKWEDAMKKIEVVDLESEKVRDPVVNGARSNVNGITNGHEDDATKLVRKRVPYSVTCSMAENGLGGAEWW